MAIDWIEGGYTKALADIIAAIDQSAEQTRLAINKSLEQNRLAIEEMRLGREAAAGNRFFNWFYRRG